MTTSINLFLFLAVAVLQLTLNVFNRLPPKYSGREDTEEKVSPADAVVSPADGTITYIKDVTIRGREYTMIHIYIGLTNVHVQVYPTDGLIVGSEYFPTGVFKDARRDTSKNEKMDTYLDNGIIVRQIAGIIARRIYAFDTVGTVVKRGGLLGKITLGSGCELFLPKDIFKVDVMNRMNVEVGKTILAYHLQQ